MKKKIMKLVSSVACSCLILSTIFQYDWISLFFFGEYPYPKKEDFM